ncbi:tripartite tricarboxylate transporter substrate-binding protein [Blastococcus xanthinilyticus]|uniref:Tripartite-type tricarboxylate transporter receptor subunit TctC n=1 Tax=Blastococcus xanthinilyticus TaxID=1564164 RepID=A0A5S5CQI7_9ACTN|nr:tripartite tricarboxylate transporter substrate-binding protein [Blastococcus xanthinilyticus]TYP84605.1 tripartite-type tricarboxylate transporter receptor subunit TctC [Blastococcus xanthinilyticus]
MSLHHRDTVVARPRSARHALGRSSRLAGLAAASLVLAACGGGGGGGGEEDPAAAEAFPEDDITFVVPFSAGGPTDTVTRLVAEPIAEELGGTVVVQNVEGAGGTIAAGEVAAANPDGYTVLMHHIGMSTAPSLYPDLPYAPLEDFEPLGLVTQVPMTIVARNDFEPQTMEELVEYVEQNAADITLANAGIGAASHLCGLLLQEALGVELTEVPYEGTGPALQDLVAGEVDLMCDQTTNTTGQIQGGQIKAYAVTTPERVETLPDLPTTEEAGLEELQVGVWHGFYVPTGTPEGIREKLSAAILASLEDENVVSQLGELGAAPFSQEEATPEAHRQLLEDQIELWQPIIEEAGVAAD